MSVLHFTEHRLCSSSPFLHLPLRPSYFPLRAIILRLLRHYKLGYQLISSRGDKMEETLYDFFTEIGEIK